MKQRKLTLSIGITAHNEEQAFPNLLKVLSKQKMKSFLLEKIVIVSDGSTDETDKRVMSFKNEKILLQSFRERKGKAYRINQIFSRVSSEILVLLDADIQIKDRLLLEKLILPFHNDAQIMGVSGSVCPLDPKTFVQRIVYAGSILWDKARARRKNADVYYCTGAIRAFRRKLYKEMLFPDISAEDVYPYLYCRSKGYSFRIVNKAVVYYGLPSTYRDYFIQMRRYVRSGTIQTPLFGENLIREEYSIGWKIRLEVLLCELLNNPFWTTLYLFCLIPVQVANAVQKHSEDSSIWKIATSSKNVR